jgi:hypothetical protein
MLDALILARNLSHTSMGSFSETIDFFFHTSSSLSPCFPLLLALPERHSVKTRLVIFLYYQLNFCLYLWCDTFPLQFQTMMV